MADLLFGRQRSCPSVIVQNLQGHGLDIGTAIEQGRYVPLDAAASVSTFMVNDLPDPANFLKVTGDFMLPRRFVLMEG